jgi:hypothetical protein
MLWQPLASEKLLAELAELAAERELSAALAEPCATTWLAHGATLGLGSLGSLRSPLCDRRPPHLSLSTEVVQIFLGATLGTTLLVWPVECSLRYHFEGPLCIPSGSPSVWGGRFGMEGVSGPPPPRWVRGTQLWLTCNRPL